MSSGLVLFSSYFVVDQKIEELNASAASVLGDSSTAKETRQAPIRLKDYHRETLLRGEIPGALDEEQSVRAQTHAQEQEQLKQALKVSWTIKFTHIKDFYISFTLLPAFLIIFSSSRYHRFSFFFDFL